MSEGIYYIATGKSFLDEAIINAHICKAIDSQVKIAICTDNVDRAMKACIFDSVIKHTSPQYTYRDKVSGLLLMPYDYTLFLDSDARLSAKFVEILDTCKNHDLSAVYAPVRIPPGWTDSSVPLNFPEINSGVLLFRKSSIALRLLADWLCLYDNINILYNQVWDQASFRSVLWNYISKKSFRFLALPQEFNLRTTKPWIAGRGMKVLIVHGRFNENEWFEFLQYINTDINRFRTWNEWLSLNPSTDIKPRHDNTFG